LLLAITSATAGCERGPVAACEIRERLTSLGRVNVVLFVVDTLRADRLTPYGFEAQTTPELARWAGRGVVFERVRAQSSWTKISMASLMTSLWPHTHGIRDARDGLGERAVTLAEVLREAGYATYAVQTNGWLHQSFGFHQGFDRYTFPRGGTAGRLERPSMWPHADRVVEESRRLITAHDTERPFFLYLHFMDVHEFAAPPEFQSFGTDSAGAYLAAIRWIDDAVARVRGELERAGRLRSTVLIFASDHGETFGEHGVYGHARNVLTPVLWVPLLIRFPFPVEPTHVATQVRNIDIAPTLLELADISAPRAFEGTSLLPLLCAARSEPDRVSYAGLGQPMFPDAQRQVSLNDGVWTYARNADSGAEIVEFLFDRRVDPGENVNLIDLDSSEVERMRSLLEQHLAREPAEVREGGVRIDPSIAERLRAMGYLR
jgi:arylsulfatase A-like enzyme